MGFKEEQEAFQREINENFISLPDLLQNIAEEQGITIKESGIYLLARIEGYLFKESEKNFLYQLEEPPYLKYSLEPISIYELREALTFLSNNGRFRSEKKIKKYGLLVEVVAEILGKTQKPNDTTGKEKNAEVGIKYNQSERITHLQIIAVLAEELAKAKGGKFLKSSGLPNSLQISELLAIRAKEIEFEALTAKSVETYRKRLAEASKIYKGI